MPYDESDPTYSELANHLSVKIGDIIDKRVNCGRVSSEKKGCMGLKCVIRGIHNRKWVEIGKIIELIAMQETIVLLPPEV
jgi:hypothetical protein